MQAKLTAFLCGVTAMYAAESALGNPKAAPAKSPAKVHWRPSYASALTEAKRTKKPIFIDFYATWCGPCKMLDQFTYTDRKFVQESQRWVMLKIDAEKNAQNWKLAKTMGADSYPTMTLLRPDGSKFTNLVGYWSGRSLAKELRKQEAKAKR